LKEVDEGAPRLPAMEGDRALKFGGEIELGLEERVLVGILSRRDGVIEADFADRREGIGEERAKPGEPIGRTIRGVPRMDSERGDDRAGILPGNVEDGVPIGFAGGTAQQEPHVRVLSALEDGIQLRGKTRILKVAVSIEKRHSRD